MQKIFNTNKLFQKKGSDLTEDTKLFKCNTIQAQPMTEAEQELNDASFTSFDDLDQFVAGANIPSLVGKVLQTQVKEKALI